MAADSLVPPCHATRFATICLYLKEDPRTCLQIVSTIIKIGPKSGLVKGQRATSEALCSSNGDCPLNLEITMIRILQELLITHPSAGAIAK